MILDIVAYLGHWPFRKLGCANAAEMAAWMDKASIEKSCVSSINSVFYKDAMEGNRELMAEIAPYADRFLLFAVINPAYPGWESDFSECFDVLGMNGLELFPAYHNYTSALPELKRLLEMAAARGIPVRLPSRLVDIRGRHWLDTPENLTPEEMESVVALCPEADFLLCSCNTASLAKRLAPLAAERKGRLFYDLARLEDCYFSHSLRALLETAGEDRVVFGSCSPFQYPEVQELKLDLLDLAPETYEKIVSGNLYHLLRLSKGC